MPHRSCIASLEIHCSMAACPVRAGGPRPITPTSTPPSYPPADLLNPRQMEVALLLVQDLSTTSIAHQLGVCNRTVEVHRDKIFQALRIPGVGALTRLMILWGKLEPDDPRMPWAPVPPPTLRKTKSALRDFPSRGGRRTA